MKSVIFQKYVSFQEKNTYSQRVLCNPRMFFHILLVLVQHGHTQVHVSSKAWMTLSYAGGGVCEGRNPLSPLLPNQNECLLFGTRAAESDEVEAAVSSDMLAWVSSPIPSKLALLLLGCGRKVEVSIPGLSPRGPTGSRDGCL